MEIVTAEDGSHHWQVAVHNQGPEDAANFKVYAVAEGYRSRDRQQLESGGIERSVEVPAPFRRDAGGRPGSALQVEKTWVRKVGGKIHWYMKTKENLYDTIDAGETGIFVRIGTGVCVEARQAGILS